MSVVLREIDLNELVNKNIFQKVGTTGRGTHYIYIKSRNKHAKGATKTQ